MSEHSRTSPRARGWWWLISLSLLAWALFQAAPEANDPVLARSWTLAGFGLLAFAVAGWISPWQRQSTDKGSAAERSSQWLTLAGFALILCAVALRLAS
ncbi:MAG: hypothetical protein RR101_02970 [Burkholderiaceae bacterium]